MLFSIFTAEEKNLYIAWTHFHNAKNQLLQTRNTSINYQKCTEIQYWSLKYLILKADKLSCICKSRLAYCRGTGRSVGKHAVKPA